MEGSSVKLDLVVTSIYCYVKEKAGGWDLFVGEDQCCKESHRASFDQF